MTPTKVTSSSIFATSKSFSVIWGRLAEVVFRSLLLLLLLLLFLLLGLLLFFDLLGFWGGLGGRALHDAMNRSFKAMSGEVETGGFWIVQASDEWKCSCNAHWAQRSKINSQEPPHNP